MITDWLKNIFKKRAIKDVIWVYAGAVSNGGALFLVSIILSHALTKEQFGVFSLAILVLSTVAELSDFGLNAGLLRFAPYYNAAGQTEKLKQLLKTIWRWRVGLTGLLTAGGIATAPIIARYVFGQPAVTPFVAYAYLGIGGVVMLGFVTTYLQSVRRFRYQAILQFCKGMIRLAGVAILAASGYGSVLNYLSVYIFVPWILFFIAYRALPKNFTKVSIDPTVKNEIHTQLAGFSVWLIVWSFMSIVAARVDQAIISKLLGLKEVAIYTVAYQFIQFFPVLTQSIASVLTPRINSLRTKAEISAFIWYALRWLAPVTILVAVLIYPSQWLIILFFGKSYAVAMPIYLVLAYGIVLNILATPLSLAVTAFNQTKLVAISGLIQLVLNVILNFALIPRFGVLGAAYAFGLGIFTAVVYNAGCVWYLLKRKELKIL